jgi:type IV pilus assembly protein PilM
MSSRVIGLDLGSSSIKAAQVLQTGNGQYVVEHQAARPLPRGVVYDGYIQKENRGLVSSVIQQMFEEEKGFTTKDVIIGLNSSARTFMEEMDVPKVMDSDIDEALPNIIAAKNPAFNENDNEIDYAVVGEVDTEHGTMLRIIVFRALADYAEDMSKIVEEAGLNVVGSDFNALAALRAIAIEHRPDRQADGVIDFGANVLTMMLHHNGVPKMIVLDPDSAGSVATEKVADALGLDEDDEQAEWYKINDDNAVGLVAQARNEYSKSTADRIANTFDKFIKASPEIDSLAKVTLVGGGALLPNLSWFLRKAFGEVPMTYAAIDPSISSASPDGVRRQEPGSGGDYLVAVGLGTGARL